MTDLRTIASRVEFEAAMIAMARRCGNQAARAESRENLQRLYDELMAERHSAEIVELKRFIASRGGL